MFKKKTRRNIRQRKGESSEEEDEHKIENKDEKKKLLDNSAVTKPSQSSQGRGISCSSKRETTPPKSDQSEGEDALDSRHSTEQKQKASAVLSFSEDKDAEGAEFKLRKSSDKAIVFQAKRKEGSSAKNTHRSRPVQRAPLPSGSPRQDSSSPASLPTPDEEDDSDGSTSSLSSLSSSPASNHSAYKPVIIPSAKTIKTARRQRQEARSQKDFISLGRDGRSSAGSTPDRRSRDSDRDDDEPDDCERRIEFAPRAKSVRERIAEKLGSSDESKSDSEEEEQKLWEETQIFKGLKRRPGEQSPSGSEASNYSSSSRSRRRNQHRQKKAGFNYPESLPPVTVSLVKRRLEGKLESLKEVHRARQAELRRMEGDVENARSSMENLEGSASDKQLRFYRAMTQYANNLVECLQEKVVEINLLELELHTLLADQMESLLADRRKSVRERAAHLQQLTHGSKEQGLDSSDGAQGEVTYEQGGVKVCSDIPEDMQPSSEEEERLQKTRADILLRAQTVFSDVQEDFSDIKKILSRFVDWRGAYSDSYHNAYINLCLPKLLSPLVRHQMLAWDPLKDVCADFEALPWYQAVETFCHGQGYEELEDSDTKTLPSVIEKTVLPKITAYVELVWDPLSLGQTAHLSDLCHKLNEDYSVFSGERSKPAKVLVEVLVTRLRSCVDEDVFIPLYPKKFLEDRMSPQCLFRDQQFWTAVKLLGNMGKWDTLLSESVLKELMLDKLLNRYLMMTLLNQSPASSTVTACSKIAGSLPLSWFTGESMCPPQLHSFTNHLVQTAHSLCSEQPPQEPDTRSAMVSVLKVLSRIRCYDPIMSIAEKYNYQDLIYTHQLTNPDTL
ncbi:GC-rich sequence DNA-binding factor 2 [Gadus macrocephalus]|uniref:GC-rich sequence DNA-binding factor 2 n=1 Tax=Gadus macrocephalus TaxID=80720 RepID=UPI0028CB921D|nr:GC-rich sequence DNA-binding factor 2 [Gadus macrocephalus]